jgi:ribosomal RNA-processing protein 8
MLFDIPEWSLGEPKTSSAPKIAVKAAKKTQQKASCPEDLNPPKKTLDTKAPLASTRVEKTVKKPAAPVMPAVSRMQTPSARSSSTHLSAVKPLNKMEEKLKGARFRFLNQRLYESDSKAALTYFKEHPDEFEHYHEGFRSQVARWPVNPVDIFVSKLQSDLETSRETTPRVVADMGCGEAKIMASFAGESRIKVHSFDLAASVSGVTVCDMSRVPLASASVDVVVFCLSLMNTNFIDALREAKRILRPRTGVLRVAEVESRFEGGNPSDFIAAVESIGFKRLETDSSHRVFILMEFVACGKPSPDTSSALASSKQLLKPCLYKKR